MRASHSYCLSNCLRFETIGNYVYYRGHLGIQYGRHRKFKIMILLDSLTPKLWGRHWNHIFICLSFKVIGKGMSNMAAILKFKMAATRGRFRVLIEKVIIQGSSASVPSFVISPQSEIFCHIFRLSRCTTSILLERLSDTLDSQMRQERAGFRRGRLCNDEVFSLSAAA